MNCKHNQMLDIVKDGPYDHLICPNCETDFGDPIDQFVNLQQALRNIIAEKPSLKIVKIATKALNYRGG